MAAITTGWCMSLLVHTLILSIGTAGTSRIFLVMVGATGLSSCVSRCL